MCSIGNMREGKEKILRFLYHAFFPSFLSFFLLFSMNTHFILILNDFVTSGNLLKSIGRSIRWILSMNQLYNKEYIYIFGTFFSTMDNPT